MIKMKTQVQRQFIQSNHCKSKVQTIKSAQSQKSKVNDELY